MIFFAACAANQADLVVEEARKAGSEDVRQTSSGVEFEGTVETGMRFCMYSRVASRLLMGRTGSTRKLQSRLHAHPRHAAGSETATMQH